MVYKGRNRTDTTSGTNSSGRCNEMRLILLIRYNTKDCERI